MKKKRYSPKSIKKGVRGVSIDVDSLYKKSKRPVPRLLVRQAIEESGKSYAEIARELGVKHSASIHKIASSPNPTFDSLKQIAFVLRIPVSKLIKG